LLGYPDSISSFVGISMTTDIAPRWTRRQALKSAAAVASTALPAWFIEGHYSRAFAAEQSPNERPKVALIGCGGRGTNVAKSAQAFGDIVAVCDVDSDHLEKARAIFNGASGYEDYRKVCDLADVDVIINGIQNRTVESQRSVIGRRLNFGVSGSMPARSSFLTLR
jgi:threonine dehydrogenase-like Zn-dependent dehydrogenase